MSNERFLTVVIHFLLRNAYKKKLGNFLLANTQLVGHLPTAITKGGLSYGNSYIATIK